MTPEEKTKLKIDGMFLTATHLIAATHGISLHNIDVDAKARTVNFKGDLSQDKIFAFLAGLNKATGGFD